MPDVKIVGIGGSMGEKSTSLAALKVALNAAAEAGATTELCDIRTLNLPMFIGRGKPAPQVALDFVETVAGAQGLIWSSPMYHGTISGAFKNAIDWLDLLGTRQPPFLSDKIIGLISTAGGIQGLQAINTMEFIVRSLRGWAVPLVLPIPRSWQIFDSEGNITDPQVEQQLRTLGKEVHRAVCHFHLHGVCEYAD